MKLDKKAKLRREFQRLKQQLNSVAEYWSDVQAAKTYDKARPDTLLHFEGDHLLCKKVAIFLIYQIGDVDHSILQTCAHFSAIGYATMVVSNGELASADRDNILKHCWRLIERPNVGHDFGGYRDGIWWLGRQNINPETLIILNDSVWFPTFDSETLVSEMEASPADFVGGQALPRAAHSTYRILLPSYFLMFKKTALQSSAFNSFWKNYIQSSRTYSTVQRGEHGLSKAMHKAGLKCDGIYHAKDVEAIVRDLDDQSLEREFQYLALTDHRLAQDYTRLLQIQQRDPTWFEQARALMVTAARQNYTATMPVLSLGKLGFPFCKKKRHFFGKSHDALCLAHENSHLDQLNPMVLAEIRDRQS